MTSRPRLQDEDYDSYRLALRTENRRLKKRLKGTYAYKFLPQEIDKKPYVKVKEDE